MKSLAWLGGLAVAATLVSGCNSDGISRPPPTFVRVINAAPSFGVLDFRREARVESSVEFGEGENHTFDSDQYDFSVRTTLPGATQSVTLATISPTVNEENEYIVVLTEAAGQLEMLLVAEPLPDPDSTASRLILIHAAAPTGRLEAYFEPDGTDLAGAGTIGNLGFRESVLAENIDAGEYLISLTEPNNPNNVLYQSEPVSVPAGASVVAVIADEGGRGTADFGVIYLDSLGGHLRDPRQPGAIRVINGIGDMAARDIYLGDDFTTPLIAGASFGSISEYVSIPPGTQALSVTPAGDPGAVELDASVLIEPSRLYTLLIGGNLSEGLEQLLTIEDHRRLSGSAQLQLFSVADQFESLAFYVLEPGADATVRLPTSNQPGNAGYAARFVVPGDYELTIRNPATGATVFEPTALTFAEGDVQGIVAVDAVGGSMVDVTIFNDSR